MSFGLTSRLVPPTHPVKPPAAPGLGNIIRAIRNPLSVYTEQFFRLPMLHETGIVGSTLHIMVPELAQEALQSDALGRSVFVRRMLTPVLRDGLLTSEGESWRLQRRAASGAFGAKALQSLVPTFDRAGQDAARRLLASAPTALAQPEMTRATFNVIVETLLRRPGESLPQRRIAEDLTTILDTIGRVNISDCAPWAGRVIPRSLFSPGHRRGQAAVSRVRAMAADIVRDRLALDDPGDDLMGLLIKARDEAGGRLDPHSLVDNALTFIFAGHETTAILLTWTLFILSGSAEVQDALAEEALRVLADDTPLTTERIAALELHERVLKEVLRLYPPAAVIPRSVVEPTRIGGVNLVRGDHVMVSVYPMHRHRDLWSDPFAFDPDRFLPERGEIRSRYQWLPFGAGPRVCIGLRLAMMEAVAILARITSNVRLRPSGAPHPTPRISITLRPDSDVPLLVAPR